MSDSQGNFVWYELTTTDPKGAAAFYGDVIGWKTQAFEGGPYTLLMNGAAAIGGLVPLDDAAKKSGTRPSWLAYVTADDVDALTKKATSLGAKVAVPPSDIPTVGRFSVIADPQGAVLALFKPMGSGMAPPTEPTQGHVTWHELLAADGEAVFGFYQQLFGWQKTEAFPMGEKGVYQIFGRGGPNLGGMMTRPEGYPLPPHWLYYVHVGDLDGALARVKTGGGQVWNGPMPIPTGNRVAQCADPAGATFALHGK